MDRHLKERFINGLNDDGIIVEIIYELIPLSDMAVATSEPALVQPKTVAAQRDQKPILSSLKENKEFDVIRSHKPVIKPIQRQK